LKVNNSDVKWDSNMEGNSNESDILALFSEPETILLKELAAHFQPHVWLNVHSGMEALFMPYDHQAAIPDDPTTESTLAILQEINRTSCGGRCAVGSGGKSVG
jgi:Zinc carboxypeptidase